MLTTREPAAHRLRDDTLAIWMAGTEAVTPRRLIADKVKLHGTVLDLDGSMLELQGLRRLVVVGAGKASAAMAIELDRQVLPGLRRELPGIQIEGWINCPEGSIAEQPTADIHLHAARPDGVNLPTAAAVAGTQRILELVRGCDSRDLVLCLISGGGSALMVAPPDGIQLSDKQEVARLVAAAGGNIQQLNCVRRALSLVKAGGLLRACRAGQLVSLVLSDVIGDPLETIASGPTVATSAPNPHEALAVLERLGLSQQPDLRNVVDYLRTAAARTSTLQLATSTVEHVLLGNNADAVDAAGSKAVQLGYRYVMQASRQPEPEVMQVAQQATESVRQLAMQDAIDCWISGGEPSVRLPAKNCGLGGRNQHLALAVMHGLSQQGWPAEMRAAGATPASSRMRPLVFLSAGTDGEDGPTDAAGAWFDAEIWKRSQALGLDANLFLRQADAYHFFQKVGSLFLTGPTGTNVCDLRVALCGSQANF